MSTFDLAAQLGVPKLAEYLDQVESGIMASFASSNQYIAEPLRRLLAKPGKRLRPALVIAIARSQGAPINKKVITCATAIELVHIGSLVHDDIIDKAQTRWNTTTINAREGVDQAIIIGDFLFAKACQLAATVNADVAEVVARTITELCDGQSRELADEFNVDRTIESTLLSITGKTASLLSAACQVGGLCVAADKKSVKALADYGKNFGLAFQLLDDVLDFLADPKLLGKNVGTDVKEGVYTLPLVLTRNGPDAKTVRNLLQQKSIKTDELIEIMIKNNSFSQAIAEAKSYNEQATKALLTIGRAPNIVALSEFPSAYFNWAFSTLVAEKYRDRLAI